MFTKTERTDARDMYLTHIAGVCSLGFSGRKESRHVSCRYLVGALVSLGAALSGFYLVLQHYAILLATRNYPLLSWRSLIDGTEIGWARVARVFLHCSSDLYQSRCAFDWPGKLCSRRHNYER